MGGVSTSTAMPPATRPKIKIIHIIAPEIIKTDVANFRDLVQRLTGKPACARTPRMATTTTAPPVQEEEEKEATTKKRPAAAAAAERLTADFAAQQDQPNKKRKIKCEVKVEEGGIGDYYDLGRSSDLWMDLNPGGFLSFLEEEAGDVFQDLAAADDFLLPLSSSRLDLVGEMYAS